MHARFLEERQEDSHELVLFQEARERFEESIRLRREIGFQPGVAAGLLALAGVADTEERAALVDEAASIAASCGADRLLRSIARMREE